MLCTQQLHKYYTSAQVIDGSKEALQAVVAQAAWAMGKGVAGAGGAAVWLNGLLLASDGGLGWAQMVPFALQMEQQRLQVLPPPPWGLGQANLGSRQPCPPCSSVFLLNNPPPWLHGLTAPSRRHAF